MAKVGRKPNLTPSVDWKVSVPVDLAAQVDLLIYDPLRGKTAYGARSSLITQAVREYVEKYKKDLTHLGTLGIVNETFETSGGAKNDN